MQLDDTLENYVRRVADFHGCFAKAPGIIIGCYMVEYAMELIGEPQGKLQAVAETTVCLTDCIQVMTGCTIGNKYLRIRDDLGRYAFSLYDRETGEGVRVFVDIDKIDKSLYPELHAFHTRSRDPKVLTDMEFRKQSGLKVVEEFRRIGRGALGHQWVRVNLPKKLPLYPSVICQGCKEPFLRRPNQPPTCPSCLGDPYYDVIDAIGSARREPARGG